MFPLHDVVFPAGSDKHEGLFLRSVGGASLRDASISLAAGQGVSSDTYFGMFPWAQWQRLTAVRTLHLAIRGHGSCDYAILRLTDAPSADDVLQSGRVALDGACLIDVSASVAGTDATALCLRLVAVTETRLDAVAFVTPTPPLRRIDLGLIITTFGRAEIVSDTIRKLEDFIANDGETDFGTISLTVVDNGRAFAPAAFPRTTVLPNPNLGGAGGFARGLSHVYGSTTASHACFMDDDAATEGECLLRTRRLLAYALDERTAVSGAMLRAETTFMMHEQGACIEWGRNHRIMSRKNGLDLLRHSALLRVLEPEPVGYGGWWLFAFPIRGALRYPYPMFVRGDDWLFSYLNSFRIETMPGLCSWQEGFENKISPTEQYLAFKAFLVAELILREPGHRLKSAYFFLIWILRNLFGYCYDRASLNCEALADVLEGPSFWESHTALGGRLAQLRGLITAERLQAIAGAAAEQPLAHLPRAERPAKTMLRSLSLNGHLVPAWLARRLVPPLICVAAIEAPQPVFAFLRQSVIYRKPSRVEAFVAMRNGPRFFALLGRMVVLFARLLWHYDVLRTTYRRSVDRVCTREWWDQTIATEMNRLERAP